MNIARLIYFSVIFLNIATSETIYQVCRNSGLLTKDSPHANLCTFIINIPILH